MVGPTIMNVKKMMYVVWNSRYHWLDRRKSLLHAPNNFFRKHKKLYVQHHTIKLVFNGHSWDKGIMTR